MAYKPKIFVSCIYRLQKESPQRVIKEEIIKRIRQADFEPQIFLEEGIAESMAWNFENVYNLLRECDGAVILGLSRRIVQAGGTDLRIPTEYNHFEGALAASLQLPLLILSEDGIEERGIFYNGGGFVYTSVPINADGSWFDKDEYFIRRFNVWKTVVKSRYQVFLGYCGNATHTANAISNFLNNRLGLRVKEYKTGFKPGRTILEEMEKASRTCQYGIFLFTADEMLNTSETGVPRDNVLFEAGYFIKARGKEHVLIICEKGVPMPADIGGNIYLQLEDRNDISGICSEIQHFLEQS